MNIKLCSINSLPVLILSIGLLASGRERAQAAAFSIDFPTTAVGTLDPFYNNASRQDGISYGFRGVTTEGSIEADMYGRYYDSDAIDPGDYGLLNRLLRPDLDPTPTPGWWVRFGLQPDYFGSKMHTHDKGTPFQGQVEASYISFIVGRGEGFVFQDITVEIRDLFGVDRDLMWAGVSTNHFSVPVHATETFTPQNGLRLQWNWNDLNDGGTEPLEIRIYGLVGADEGTFGTGLLYGTYDPPPVPEASTSLLAMLGLGWGCLRRRR